MVSKILDFDIICIRDIGIPDAASQNLKKSKRPVIQEKDFVNILVKNLLIKINKVNSAGYKEEINCNE